MWYEKCDLITLPKISLEDLKERRRKHYNTAELKASAAEQVNEMQNLSADALSAIYKDKEGQTLLCYMATRLGYPERQIFTVRALNSD